MSGLIKSRILFVFLFLGVFYFSSENVDAVTCPSCFPGNEWCSAGSTYAGDCENKAGCTACPSPGTNFCDGDVISTYSLSNCGHDFSDGSNEIYSKCKIPLITCSAPTPRCYDNGATVTCVQCLTNADCTAPDTCDITTHQCISIPPLGCDQNLDSIIDTAVDACCVKYPGTKCQWDDGTSSYRCLSDASCSICSDDDNGKNTHYKATCRDTTLGACNVTAGGCTDACASSGSVNEFYCSGGAIQSCASEQIACPSGEFCDNGVCTTGPSDPSDPAPTPVGCTWLATNFNPPFGVCSSGCPTSYADQQFVCCETAPLGCRNAPQCTSYNPQNGETPCCTTGGYYTCTAQETCTEIQNTSRKVFFIYNKS